jgi:polyvinyl alcohol dehydrogenase (cytochrome)
MVSFGGSRIGASIACGSTAPALGGRASLYVALLLGLSACSPSSKSGANSMPSAMLPGTGGSTTTQSPITQGSGGSQAAIGGAGNSVGDPDEMTPGQTNNMPGTGGSSMNTPQVDGGTMKMDPGTPPVTGSDDWPMMGYDLGSTYFNSAENTITKDNVAQLEVAWTADFGGNVYGAPLQIGDKIYASGGGTVQAFDAATGNPLWSTPVYTQSALSYVDGTLYINDQTANIVALNAADGMQLWSKPVDSSGADGSSSVIAAGDLLLVGGSSGIAELSGGGTFKGYVGALTRMTGEKAWLTYTVPDGSRGASVWSTVSVDLDLGFVFAGTGNNYGAPATDTSDAIIAFKLTDGTIAWKNQRIMNDTFGAGSGPDSDFGANPVLYETMVNGVMTKMVADGAKGGTVHGLQREDGKEVWTRSLCMGQADGSNGIFTNFTWTGKNLFVSCNAGGPAKLFGLDPATGDILWMRDLQGQTWGRAASANGVGFVGSGSTMEAFDVDTGALIKSWPSKGGTLAGGITVAHGRVAFGEGLQWSSGIAGTTLTVLAIK